MWYSDISWSSLKLVKTVLKSSQFMVAGDDQPSVTQPWLVFLKVLPIFDSMRSDERFNVMLKKMRLDE